MSNNDQLTESELLARVRQLESMLNDMNGRLMAERQLKENAEAELSASIIQQQTMQVEYQRMQDNLESEKGKDNGR